MSPEQKLAVFNGHPTHTLRHWAVTIATGAGVTLSVVWVTLVWTGVVAVLLP